MVYIKTPEEIDLLRRAADLVGRTHAEVARLIKPGVTPEELDTVAEAYIRKHGAVPAFKGYRVGGNVFPSTLCISINDVIVHGIPNSEPLTEGDVVSVDCGVVLDGFFGDSAYTYAVGRVREEDALLCRTTYESLMQAVMKAVHGARLGDIGSAVQSYCEDRGYGVVRDLVGHGIGRRMHEEPQVPNFGRSGTGKKLKAGTTICIEPMINGGTARIVGDDDGWTIRTADGSTSAHYEHMVAVGIGKPDVLSTFKYIEEVVEPPMHWKTNG
jgi:methionyl aminopeptidase